MPATTPHTTDISALSVGNVFFDFDTKADTGHGAFAPAEWRDVLETPPRKLSACAGAGTKHLAVLRIPYLMARIVKCIRWALFRAFCMVSFCALVACTIDETVSQNVASTRKDSTSPAIVADTCSGRRDALDVDLSWLLSEASHRIPEATLKSMRPFNAMLPTDLRPNFQLIYQQQGDTLKIARRLHSLGDGGCVQIIAAKLRTGENFKIVSATNGGDWDALAKPEEKAALKDLAAACRAAFPNTPGYFGSCKSYGGASEETEAIPSEDLPGPYIQGYGVEISTKNSVGRASIIVNGSTYILTFVGDRTFISN